MGNNNHLNGPGICVKGFDSNIRGLTRQQSFRSRWTGLNIDENVSKTLKDKFDFLYTLEIIYNDNFLMIFYILAVIN